MCDVKKYSDIFREIKKLNPDDILQLVLESQTEEEKLHSLPDNNTK